MPTKQAPIAAIDVGYGNCKYCSEISRAVQHFPSLAVRASSADLGGGALSSRQTLRVLVNGEPWEVGRDAKLASRNPTKILDEAYTDSPQYRALTNACLLSLGPERVSSLTSGLPVSLFAKLKDELADRLVGVHEIAEGHYVTVDSAQCVPQPLGGYMAYMYERRAEDYIRNISCLVVDVGHFSVDWLVVDRFTPDVARSNTYFGGVFAIIQSIQQQIAADGVWGVEPRYVDVDDALRNGGSGLALFGRPVDLQSYIEQAVRQEAASAVAQMRNVVGDGRDIDRIVLVGGGAPIYRQAVAEGFPRHTVECLDNPVVANVSGYLRLMELKRARAAA